MNEPIISKVNALLAQREFSEAKRTLELSIDEYKDFYLYWEKHADACEGLGDRQSAYNSLQRAVALRPNFARLRQKLEALSGASAQLISADLAVTPGHVTVSGADANEPFCGIFERYPDRTGRRQLEGGLRLTHGIKPNRPHRPLVSVVTVVYNNAETLPRCIESVLAQTYDNVEYIVIDGGSSKPTLDVIARYADRIDYFLSEPDGGIYDAMNKGIELAQGDYVCLLNSDDIYKSEFIERSVELALQRNSTLVYSHFLHKGEEIRAEPVGPGIYLGHLNINHSTFLTHRDCYNKIGRYDSSFRIVSDAIWMRKAYREGISFDLLEEAHFDFSEGGLSSGSSQSQRDLFIGEVVSSYLHQFGFLSPEAAREIYLLRFNARRLPVVLSIAKGYSKQTEFHKSLGGYISFCMRRRDNFRLTKSDSDELFPHFTAACEAFDIPFSAIRLPTKHGCFSKLAGLIDEAIGLRKTKPVKTILHYAAVFSSPSETFIYDLLLRLGQDTDFDNFILFDQRKLPEERPFQKSLWVPWGDLAGPIREALYKYVFARLKPDVIVGHFALNTWKLCQRLDPIGISRPTVSMTHGIDVAMLAQPGEYRDYVLQRLLPRTDVAFSTVSDYLHKQLVDAGVPETLVSTIPNTVNPRFFAHRRESAGARSGNQVKLLAVGRLVPVKGHRYLLEALADARRRTSSELSLTIVYGNSDELLADLSKLVEGLGIQHLVQFVPFVDFNEEPDFYSRFDVFVHPSTFTTDALRRTETFGVAVLEAIAAGLAVVATEVGGIPEVVGNDTRFARVVPHADAPALANAIVDLIETGAYAQDNLAYAQERLSRYSESRQIASFAKLVYKASKAEISVAMFSTSTVQGAGYAAFRLHRGLSRTSTRSRLYTTVRDHETAAGVTRVSPPSGRGESWRWLQNPNYSKPHLTIFTVDYPTLNNTTIAQLVADADIVNLHWTARFLSVTNIASLTHAHRPVVLTVRDMQPLTGGCHYFHGCREWQCDCRNCPQLVDHWDQFPAKILKMKRDLYDFSNLTLVALSQHTKRILQRAPAFSECRIEVIPNSIETDVFVPRDRREARQALGLPLDRKVIGYVPSFSSEVKGFREATVALNRLKRNQASDPVVMLVGNRTPATDSIQLEKYNIGYVSDNARLSLVYSAADVVIVPSLEETFSNTTAESIACGTPVVGFKTGAIPEMVIDGVTGYTFDPGDAIGLAEGVARVLTGPDLSGNCRQYALKNLHFDIQARRYEELFIDLHVRNKRRCNWKSKHSDAAADALTTLLQLAEVKCTTPAIHRSK